MMTQFQSNVTFLSYFKAILLHFLVANAAPAAYQHFQFKNCKYR